LLFSAFSRRIFHPRPQDGVFRCAFNKTLDLFEVNKIPATLIIDKNGKMIGRAMGPRNWSSPEVFSLIDQMLHDRPARVVSLKD
jgi:hypothetical protein